jgi:LysM repeat protein
VLSPELMAAQGHRHVIQPGDTLMGLGYRYGVNWQDLAVINALPDPDRLSVGVALTIPVIHTAQRISGVHHPELDAEVSLFVRKEIVVELSKQIVTAYENGRLIKTVTVSTGLPATPTVQGEFSIYVKRPSQTMSGPGYFLPDVPYVMYFYQGYGLHGTYWHDNFGQPMSHGCVNMPTPEAEWMYTWAPIGTPVHVQQ